jgi:hypothetical protein
MRISWESWIGLLGKSWKPMVRNPSCKSLEPIFVTEILETSSTPIVSSNMARKKPIKLASGNDCYIANWKMTIEIVDFP